MFKDTVLDIYHKNLQEDSKQSRLKSEPLVSLRYRNQICIYYVFFLILEQGIELGHAFEYVIS